MAERKQIVGVKEKGSKQIRIRATPDEISILNELRRIENECAENGLDPKDVKAGWIKNENSSLYFRNPNFEGALEKEKEFKDRLFYFPKGGKFEVNHNDDFTDNALQISVLIGYIYEPPVVNG